MDGWPAETRSKTSKYLFLQFTRPPLQTPNPTIASTTTRRSFSQIFATAKWRTDTAVGRVLVSRKQGRNQRHPHIVSPVRTCRSQLLEFLSARKRRGRAEKNDERRSRFFGASERKKRKPFADLDETRARNNVNVVRHVFDDDSRLKCAMFLYIVKTFIAYSLSNDKKHRNANFA